MADRRPIAIGHGRDLLEHLHPFVRAVQQAKNSQRADGARKLQFRRPSAGERQRQPHREESQAVEEVNLDDVVHEELRDWVHDTHFSRGCSPA